MLTSVDIERPDIMVREGVDRRGTFRRSVENRLRPRMNALRREVQQNTIYPAIAEDFIVEQRSTPDSVAFALVNTNDASRYLLAPHGTRAHNIVQRAHLIPVGKLVSWLFHGGSTGVPPMDTFRTAFGIRQSLNERDIVIEHPGTRPDQPTIDAVNEAEPKLIEAAERAIEYWSARFGIEEAT